MTADMNGVKSNSELKVQFPRPSFGWAGVLFNHLFGRKNPWNGPKKRGRYNFIPTIFVIWHVLSFMNTNNIQNKGKRP